MAAALAAEANAAPRGSSSVRFDIANLQFGGIMATISACEVHAGEDETRRPRFGLVIAMALVSTCAHAQLAPFQTKTFQLSTSQVLNVAYGSAVASPSLQQGNSASMAVMSLTAGVQAQRTLLIGGAKSIFVSDATATPAGGIAAVGFYRDQSDRVSAFLARISSSGVVGVDNLGNYAAHSVCATSDGRLWLLGQDTAKEIDYVLGRPNSDYGVLRAFDSSGKPVGTYLQRSSFKLPSGVPMLLPDSQQNQLACGSDSVGVYLGGVATPVWYQIDSQTLTSRTWQVVAGVPAGKLSGLAVPSASRPYASYRLGKSNAIYSLALADDGSAGWNLEFVDAGPDTYSAQVLKVLGSDSSSLVYVVGAATQAGSIVLGWTKPVATSSIAAVTPDGSSSGQSVFASNASPVVVDRVVALSANAIAIVKASPGICTSASCKSALGELSNAVTSWASLPRPTASATLQRLQQALARLQTAVGQSMASAARPLTLVPTVAAQGVPPESIFEAQTNSSCESNCDHAATTSAFVCGAAAFFGPGALAFCSLAAAGFYANCLHNCANDSNCAMDDDAPHRTRVALGRRGSRTEPLRGLVSSLA